MKVNGCSWGFMVICFFRKRYAVQIALHISSSIPMAGYLFHFGGNGPLLFSVFRKWKKEMNIFGGIIPLLHTGFFFQFYNGEMGIEGVQ